jgi:hypothetical protein
MSRHREHTLQYIITASDGPWSYHVPNLANSGRLIKSIDLHSDPTSQAITLRWIQTPGNRATSSIDPDHLIHITVSDFRLQDNSVTTSQPATMRESVEYLIRFLKSGVTLNGTHYSFYGHSNSQLKSRS